MVIIGGQAIQIFKKILSELASSGMQMHSMEGVIQQEGVGRYEFTVHMQFIWNLQFMGKQEMQDLKLYIIKLNIIIERNSEK